jgi:hypothetical protein
LGKQKKVQMPGKCDQPGQKGTDLRLVQFYSQLAVENLTILTRDIEFCLAINNLPSGETTYVHALGFKNLIGLDFEKCPVAGLSTLKNNFPNKKTKASRAPYMY